MTIETVKVNISSLKEHKRKVLEVLQDQGVVDVEKKEEGPTSDEEELDNLEYKAAEAKSAIDFLESHQDQDGGLLDSLIPDKLQVKEEDFKNIDSNFDGEKVNDEVLDLEEKLNQLQSTLQKSKKKLKELEKWKKLTLSKDQLQDLQRAEVVFGKITSSKLEELLVTLKRQLSEVVILKGGEDARNVYLALVFPKKKKEEIEEILEQEGLEELSPDFQLSPHEHYQKIKEKIERLQQKKEKANSRIEELLEHQKNLKIYHDWIISKLKRKKTERHLEQSERVFTITGWVREDRVDVLKRRLAEYTEDVAVTRAEDDDKSKNPVVIDNGGTFKPYEMITKLYGMPQGSEPDPTVYLAPFFTAFFAMAITDAGYGIIMMVLSVVLLRFTDLPGRRLFKILFWAGVFTLGIGALFGGWFGVSAPDLPNALGPIKTVLTKIMWMDPVDNPVKTLIFTFVLGIIQILAGIGVATYWKIKQGKIKAGLMDHASWFVFLAAIFTWVAVKFGYLNYSTQLAGYGLIAALVFFLYCQGRGHKNLVKRMFIGMGSLYDLLGYVSDVLSYSRLLALGLATAIIAMVVNLIAGIFMEMVTIPGLNWVLGAFILILGHSFNLVVNSLSGFIHSARLQFVEFFPKFMKGGGRRFDPFKNSGDYIELNDN